MQGIGAKGSATQFLWIFNLALLIVDVCQFITILVLNALGDTELITVLRMATIHGGNITEFNSTVISNSTAFCTISHGHHMTLDRLSPIHVEWLLASILLFPIAHRTFTILLIKDHMKRVKYTSDLFYWIEVALQTCCMAWALLAMGVDHSLNEYMLGGTCMVAWAALLWMQEEWNAMQFQMRFQFMIQGEEGLDPRDATVWYPFWVGYGIGVLAWVGLGMTLFFNLSFLPTYVIASYFFGLGYGLLMPWIQTGFYMGWWDFWSFGSSSRKKTWGKRLSDAFAAREVFMLGIGFLFRAAFIWMILGFVFDA